MLYVIGQLWIFLLLTAASAAFAGWMWAAHRAEPARQGLRRRRDRLVRDLAQLAAGEGWDDGLEAARAADRDDSLSRIRESRIAELEHALESARLHAGEAAAEAAELRRRFEQGGDDSAELAQLRGLLAAHAEERAREIETEAETVSTDDAALQAWRLRYFEQRVRYLEERGGARVAVAGALAEEDPLPGWRAREAEARAAYLEQELRALTARAAETPAAAPDAGVDALLRWRMRYLEQRTAHLQQRAAAPLAGPQAPAEAGPDPDRWKWRARYLEARVRHFEQRVAPAAPVAAPAPAAAQRPARRGVKPPLLASARNGAPDDLTLIDGVSLQRQSTFYSLGVFHFDQIAAWTPDHVAWVDQYLRLGGRIDEEGWVEQADELAREGPAAVRRVPADATA